MPIYEYKCSNCSHEFEKIQKISEEPIKECPKCNRKSVSKLISAPSFRLKGSGWYETDFKTGSKKNLVQSEPKEKKAKPEKKESTKKSKKVD